MDVETNLKTLGLVLPPAPKPAGSYRPVVFAGETAFLSGQISKPAEGDLIVGKLGSDLTLEEGQAAARVAALNVISIIKHMIGFDRFERFLRVVGFVQCDPYFSDIHKVMNGASELFQEALGEAGIHARSAVGMISLPLNAAVEIEATIQLKV